MLRPWSTSNDIGAPRTMTARPPVQSRTNADGVWAYRHL